MYQRKVPTNKIIRTVRIPFNNPTDLVRVVKRRFSPYKDPNASGNNAQLGMSGMSRPSVSVPNVAGERTEGRKMIEVEPGHEPMRSFVGG